MLSYLLDGLKFLCFEGSWKLNPHEAETLQAVLDWMPAGMKGLATRQLEQPFFIERMSRGRIPCFRYYRMDPSLRFRGEFRSGNHFIDVRLIADGRKMTGKCVLHEGTVFGLEFPRPTAFFRNATIEVLSVSCAASTFSYTEVLDRAEHGPGGEG